MEIINLMTFQHITADSLPAGSVMAMWVYGRTAAGAPLQFEVKEFNPEADIAPDSVVAAPVVGDE